MSADQAAKHLRALMSMFWVWPAGVALLNEAMRGVEDYKFNYWDALIWAAAREAQARVVLSEDFSPGSTIEGVTFINPFTDAFDIDALLA